MFSQVFIRAFLGLAVVGGVVAPIYYQSNKAGGDIVKVQKTLKTEVKNLDARDFHNEITDSNEFK